MSLDWLLLLPPWPEAIIHCLCSSEQLPISYSSSSIHCPPCCHRAFLKGRFIPIRVLQTPLRSGWRPDSSPWQSGPSKTWVLSLTTHPVIHLYLFGPSEFYDFAASATCPPFLHLLILRSGRNCQLLTIQHCCFLPVQARPSASLCAHSSPWLWAPTPMCSPLLHVAAAIWSVAYFLVQPLLLDCRLLEDSLDVL